MGRYVFLDDIKELFDRERRSKTEILRINKI